MLQELQVHGVLAFAGRSGRGLHSPSEKLMWTLQQYQYIEAVLEGVLYIHDDAILNITQLSQGQYPFPTDRIIAGNYSKEPNSQDLLAFTKMPDWNSIKLW
jgi:CTP:molybdopterin cytidylyltransferase MocA